MIFRQMFERDTSTYTYLLADEQDRKAVLIDPVKGHCGQYLKLLDELGLKLAHAVDTHVHADHITALGDLRNETGCVTYVGHEGSVSCSDVSLCDGMCITFGRYWLKALYTPGHTDDSFCFLLKGYREGMVFTGDTLLIRGTGRTDFQNGSSEQLYQSLHHCLMTLPDETLVYPGHDYKGMTVSTIAEERMFNPRLQWPESEFAVNMANLNLAQPRYIDVAVPANKQCGQLAMASDTEA